MRLSHVSLTARDAKALSSFYKEAFGLADLRPPRRLCGETVSRGNGLANSDIYVVWLSPPETARPFLEIMQYDHTLDRSVPAVNEPGFGHLAFEVPDLSDTLEKVLRLGGKLQGKNANFGTKEDPHLIVYVRDPEENIIELEQPRTA